MPRPVIPSGIIASPEGIIVREPVVVETTHLLRQLEVLIRNGIGIDTLLGAEADGIIERRIGTDHLIITLRATVILIYTTVTAYVIHIGGDAVIVRHLLNTLFLWNEIEVIILCHQRQRQHSGDHGNQ